MKRAAFAILVAVAAAPLLAQQDFSKVEIKVQKVAGSVYMLTGQGGNIGVSAGEDGIVIIDDQYAPLAPKIKEALKTITDKPLRFVINTHYHGDHTGGNETFGKEATIIAHENARARLVSGTTVMGRNTPPAPKGALPIITFNDRTSVHINGEDVRAVHYPHGHTDGDAVIFFQQPNVVDVVHMGDDFFNGMFPFVDIENGGSVRGMLANVEAVLAKIPDDAKVIPGHGALSDKKGLRAFGDMLRGTTNAVAAGIKAGKTAEQLKTEKALAAWDDWGKGFINADRFIDALYADLTKK